MASMNRYKGVGPNGRRVCRWCGTEVPKGRRSWCSDACVDEYLGTKGHAHLIERVFARNKGVCAECGLDTVTYRRKRYADRQHIMGPRGYTVCDYELDGWD